MRCFNDDDDQSQDQSQDQQDQPNIDGRYNGTYFYFILLNIYDYSPLATYLHSIHILFTSYSHSRACLNEFAVHIVHWLFRLFPHDIVPLFFYTLFY